MDDYKLLELMGQGSFAKVYKAYTSPTPPSSPLTPSQCKKTNQLVAIKVIDIDSQEKNLRLLQREMEIITKCNHPNIMKLYRHFYTSKPLVLPLFVTQAL